VQSDRFFAAISLLQRVAVENARKPIEAVTWATGLSPGLHILRFAQQGNALSCGHTPALSTRMSPDNAEFPDHHTVGHLQSQLGVGCPPRLQSETLTSTQIPRPVRAWYDIANAKR